jgi:hypothetical protein
MNAPDGALARAYENESNNLADVRVWHWAAVLGVRGHGESWRVSGREVSSLIHGR